MTVTTRPADPGPNSIRKAHAAHLPDKIQCAACRKWRAQDAYSKRQLMGNKLKIKCRYCTGDQVKELACTVCGEVKDLGEFSRAQRKAPDVARCMACVRLHLDTEPGMEPEEKEGREAAYADHRSDVDVDNDDDDDDDDDGSNPYDFGDQDESDHVEEPTSYLTMDKLTLSPTLPPRSKPDEFERENLKPGTHPLSGANVARLSEGYAKDNATTITATNTTAGGVRLDEDDDDDGWITPSRKQQARRGGTSYIGYDAHGVGHTRVRAPSTIVSADVGLGRASKRQEPQVSRRGGFAKVKNTPADRPAESHGGIFADPVVDEDEEPKKKKKVPLEEGEEHEDDDYLAGW